MRMVDGTAAEFADRLACGLRRLPDELITLGDNQVGAVVELLSHLDRYTTPEAAPVARVARELGQRIAACVDAAGVVVGRVGRPVAEVSAGEVAVRNPAARSHRDIGAEDVAVIVRRRADGELLADIGRDYRLSPLAVLELLRSVRNGERGVPVEVVQMAERAVSVRRDFHGVA